MEEIIEKEVEPKKKNALLIVSIVGIVLILLLSFDVVRLKHKAKTLQEENNQLSEMLSQKDAVITSCKSLDAAYTYYVNQMLLGCSISPDFSEQIGAAYENMTEAKTVYQELASE